VFPKWAWSGSHEQFLRFGLRKFRHSKSSVYRWYPQLVRGRFVHDTYRTLEATRSRHGWVHMFITHCVTVTLQLHNFDLFRTCRTSSSCTVAWQLARFQLTRRIVRSLADSWASCLTSAHPVHTQYTALCRCVLGVGGQIDFMRGAALCLDGLGKPILAMSSATKKGETKIVPVLKPGQSCCC